jgi:(R,R)-butanediol dehydrogenase / meso-butanediol dehydrogenase / diacetyl reductase
MKAAVFHQAGQPLSIEQVPDPQPAPDEVLIEVARAGICGSDLHVTAAGAVAPGTILGHEFAGSIAAIGSAVAGPWRVGDRVTALPLHSCEHCEQCEQRLPALCTGTTFTGTTLQVPGAYAQYVRARAGMLQQLPAGVSFDEGAMIEPLAVSHHAVVRAALRAGASVLVLGAGPIGAGVALFARLAGARHVVVCERFAERRQHALAVGATAVIDPAVEDVATAFHAHAGCRPQWVFECVGKPGLLRQALDLAGIGGRVVVAGLSFADEAVNPLACMLKEVSIQFSQCYTERDFAAVSDAIARGHARPQPLHTGTVGFAELPAVFESLRAASPHCKVLIDPAR